ncbi:hypothetical protein, partial [Sphingobacterium suaedae]
DAEQLQEGKPSSEQTQDSAKAPEPAGKPTGFKPRFKAGVTKPATEQPDAEQLQEGKPSSEQTQDSAKAPEPAGKPTGFKPRFKAGITKNKPADDNPSQ